MSVKARCSRTARAEEGYFAARRGQTTTPTQVEAEAKVNQRFLPSVFLQITPDTNSTDGTDRTVYAATGRQATYCNATQQDRQSPQTLQVGLLSVSAS